MHLHDIVLKQVHFEGVHQLQPNEGQRLTWQSVRLKEPRLWRTEAATRTPAWGSIQSASPYTKLTGTCTCAHTPFTLFCACQRTEERTLLRCLGAPDASQQVNTLSPNPLGTAVVRSAPT